MKNMIPSDGAASPIYKSVEASAVATLSDWTAMARGAFAANTVRAWRADWELFGTFCHSHQLAALPATAKTVREFVSRPATGWLRGSVPLAVTQLGQLHFGIFHMGFGRPMAGFTGQAFMFRRGQFFHDFAVACVAGFVSGPIKLAGGDVLQRIFRGSVRIGQKTAASTNTAS